jgi:hypothetical protein
MIGDLQGHLRTRREIARYNSNIFWLCPDLLIEDQQILAATIDAWLEENENNIPYSVADPGGIKFRDNIWVGNEPGQGLTCATFIAELFKELAIPFIDMSTWIARLGDEAWANQILQCFKHEMTDEHVQAQIDRIGNAIRVRPIDITAAGAKVQNDMEKQLTFTDVDPISKQVESHLRKQKN